ncbi:hypothetical protein FOG48_00876 [Hanseniaspora uvarum]|nr:hypothetical protein FOG48_00876 [Hanseniaspora uvarum]
MFNISRFVPRTPFFSKHIITTKRYAAVSILGYDLYKQWYLSNHVANEANVLSRNTLIARTWKALSISEKEGWVLKAKMMTENMIEQKKQVYESKQFSIFSRMFCFYNIPGIIQEIKASNPINSYDSLFEGKLKILEFLLELVSSEGNRVEKVKIYVQLLNSLMNPDFADLESPEMQKLQSLFPESSTSDIYSIWVELLSDVQDISFKNFVKFTSEHENSKILILFIKYFQRLTDKVPNAPNFIKDLGKITPYINSSSSRFELFFSDQFSVIDNPYEFMINFKSILKETHIKYNELTDEELKTLDEKSLQLERYPVVQQGLPIYKKNLPYPLYVKESFYKRYFDAILHSGEWVSSPNTTKAFKNYNFEESEVIEAEEIESINAKGDDESKEKYLKKPLKAFIDLNKEWHDMSNNKKTQEYWQKMIQRFDDGVKKYTSPHEAEMRKLMGAVKVFDNPLRFKGYNPKLLYAELNFSQFNKYVEISSRRNKSFSFSKNRTSSVSAQKKTIIKSLDSSDPTNDDLNNGSVFYNFYERLFETQYDCFELEDVFKAWDNLSNEEKCRYYILCSVLRFQRGCNICFKIPVVFGKKLGTSDFTYVLNKHMDASYLKEIYPYNETKDLSLQPELWPQVYAKRARALKRFADESLNIYKYLENVNEKTKTKFRKVIIHKRSVAKSMATLFESRVPDNSGKTLTYEDFFLSRKHEILKEWGFDNIQEYISSFENSIDLFHDSIKLIHSQIDNYEAHLGELIIKNGFSSKLTGDIQSTIKFKDFNSPPKIYFKLFSFANRRKKTLLQACIDENIILGKPLTEKDILGDKELPDYVYQTSSSQRLYDYLCSIALLSSIKATNNCIVSTPHEKNPAKFHIIEKMGPTFFFKNVLKKFPYETVSSTLLRAEHNAYMHAYRDGSLQKAADAGKKSSSPSKLDCSFLVEFRERMFEEQVSIYKKMRENDPSSNIKFTEVVVSKEYVLALLDKLEYKYNQPKQNKNDKCHIKKEVDQMTIA